MAAGPATLITSLKVYDSNGNYVIENSAKQNRILASGAAARDPYLQEFVEGVGNKFNMPFLNDLDESDSENVAQDVSLPFKSSNLDVLPAGQSTGPDPSSITSGEQVAMRFIRNKSWSAINLTKELTSSDPLQACLDRYTNWWAQKDEARIIAMIRGIQALDAAKTTPTMTFDASGTSFVPDTTNFTNEAFIDATATMGENQDLAGGIMIVHPIVYARIRKTQIVDIVPDPDTKRKIPYWNGMELFVSRLAPVDVSGKLFTSLILGRGCIAYGETLHKKPLRIEELQQGGNGDGQDVLWSRRNFSYHPKGFAFKPSVGQSSGGPENTGTANNDLDEPGSWEQVYREREQVNMTFLVTRESA